jgi:hypothetical protein
VARCAKASFYVLNALYACFANPLPAPRVRPLSCTSLTPALPSPHLLLEPPRALRCGAWWAGAREKAGSLAEHTKHLSTFTHGSVRGCARHNHRTVRLHLGCGRAGVISDRAMLRIRGVHGPWPRVGWSFDMFDFNVKFWISSSTCASKGRTRLSRGNSKGVSFEVFRSTRYSNSRSILGPARSSSYKFAICS